MYENKYLTYTSRRNPLSFCESEVNLVRILRANSAFARRYKSEEELDLWKKVNNDYIFVASILLRDVPEDKKELEEFVAHLVKE